MAIYGLNGIPLSSAYNANGTELIHAYDVGGTEVYSKQPHSLVVMTYNVGQWYIGTTSRVPVSKKSEYYAIHNGAFSNYRPDVLLMQEALSTWCDDGSLSADLLAPYFDDIKNTRPTTAYQGHYICTKNFPMSNYTVHPFSVNKGNYPSFESAQITVGGRVVNIVNTHNDTVDSYAQQEVADLLAALQNMEYFILCGDFNCIAETVGDAEYKLCIKPFLDAGYHVGNCNGEYWINTYFATADPNGTRYKTDNVITSANITIDDLYADTTKLTDGLSDKIDHIPLIAELTIN